MDGPLSIKITWDEALKLILWVLGLTPHSTNMDLKLID